MPGADVVVVRGRVTMNQVASRRPSYINALLIQRAGILVPAGCNECQRRGFTPFPECRIVYGHFDDACGNCKWRDHGARCGPVDDQSGDGSDADDGDSSSDGSFQTCAEDAPATAADEGGKLSASAARGGSRLQVVM
jgi:hypothetical protein